jgi:ParB family protein of integrating conjugative element (PFGI_1 class)
MADMTSQDMAGKLLAAGFERSGPAATALSDPIADTPMVVTLDQLRPYDHDPRMKRNPAYEEIKASIRERGLDAAPAITRRPGGDHYIIRNGGNTRLAILRELWSETKEERFFRISCLFRPWPERGEIVALTGHLAENELRGGLTFIERALGVEKAREFYEQESGAALSQSELARRLAADGFPVQRSHITRMADAVRYLLPAIPTVLYGGLGRHQVERLSVMRTACKRTWEHYAKDRWLPLDFDSFFQEVLAQFDTQGDEFAPQRVQDELIGQMSELLGIGYDVLALDLTESESRHRALVSDPTPPAAQPALPSPTAGTPTPPGAASSIATPAAAAGPPPASPPASEPTLRHDDTAAGERRPREARRLHQSDLLRRAHRLAGTDDRTAAVDPAHGRRPVGRCAAARLLGERVAVHPGASRRTLSDLRCLVHRRRPGHARSAAHPHRAVRARDRRGGRPGRVHRGSRRWHRLRLRAAPAAKPRRRSAARC